MDKKELLASVALILALGLIEVRFGRAPLQRGVMKLTLPLTLAATQATRVITAPLLHVRQWTTTQQRLTQLEEELAQSEGTIAQLTQLRQENENLRALLENRHLQVKPRRLARPVVSSVVPLVWLGETGGVRPGWLVLYKDTLLGYVESIDGQYARVALLSVSPEAKLLVQTASGAKGIARAVNGRVVVTNVAPEQLLQTGERVVTIGQPGIVAGKFVGIISEVQHDAQAATQTLVVDQLVSFYQTSVVELEE